MGQTEHLTQPSLPTLPLCLKVCSKRLLMVQLFSIEFKLGQVAGAMGGKIILGSIHYIPFVVSHQGGN